VPYETLVFQILHVDAVPKRLRDFLNNDAIIIWGAEIQCDVYVLEYYGITIHGAHDLQKEIPNPTRNYPPGLYDLLNAYIQTKISKNDPKIALIRRDRWADIPFTFEQVK
jgi:hypothetical protein